MGDTKIQWATKVWNPVSGCTKVSQGCRNCYAERIAERFWGKAKFTDVRCHPLKLEEPLHWRKPQRVFVDSMSDLFHPDVPGEFIRDVFTIMKMVENRKHTFMVLTKRPERMRDVVNRLVGYPVEGQERIILPNVWLGVSVEDQATADERIPLLLQTPAAVRFVSYEPALGGVNISWAFGGWHSDPRPVEMDPGIDWIICGCESGPGARPMDIEWVRSMRDQCVANGVPFFFKQKRIGKTILHTPSLDGVYWQQFPEVR